VTRDPSGPTTSPHPIRKPTCRELLQWEHGRNSQVCSIRAPVERAIATLKAWRILVTDYRRPLNFETFKSSFASRHRSLLLQGGFRITSSRGDASADLKVVEEEGKIVHGAAWPIAVF